MSADSDDVSRSTQAIRSSAHVVIHKPGIAHCTSSLTFRAVGGCVFVLEPSGAGTSRIRGLGQGDVLGRTLMDHESDVVRGPNSEDAVRAEDAAGVSEIVILPDGRVYVLGLTDAMLDLFHHCGPWRTNCAPLLRPSASERT